MRKQWVAALGVIVGIGLVLSAGVASAGWHDEPHIPEDSWDRGTVEGGAIPIPEGNREHIESEVELAVDQHPSSDVSTWLIANDHATYIVVSKVEPDFGEAKVTGEIADTGTGYKILLAETVDINTDPTRVSEDEFRKDPRQFRYKYIKVTGTYTQVPFSYDGDVTGFKQPEIRGSFHHVLLPGMVGPRFWAQYSVINASQGYKESIYGLEYFRFYISNSNTIGYHNDFWIYSHETTFRGVVMPRPMPLGPDSINLNTTYIDHAEPESENVDSIEAAVSTDDVGGPIGDAVSFEADAYGSTFSTKEVLVKASPCDGEITVGTPPVCIPAVTDSTVHAGVAVETKNGELNAIPIIGLSNHLQDRMAEPFSGRYRITGEIRHSQMLHPGLAPEYGIFVFDMERIGDEELTGQDANEAAELGDEISEATFQQLQTLHWEETNDTATNQTIGDESEKWAGGKRGTNDDPTTQLGSSPLWIPGLSIMVAVASIRWRLAQRH